VTGLIINGTISPFLEEEKEEEEEEEGHGQIFRNITVSAFLMLAQYDKFCFLQGHATISTTAKC
jgi:hypothetical protein